MHSLVSSLVSSLASSSLAVRAPPPQTWSEVATVGPGWISTSTVHDTFIYTCPPIPTVFVNVTQYVPVTATDTTSEYFTDTTTASLTNTTTASYTETTTTPITIYQTIISTTILTTTEIVTETSTTVSPSPTTLTATEELLLETFTTEVTSITLCPTRIVNPTFTALGPFPTDWTWGCPPGWLCRPSRQNCNFEAGLPDQNFYCAPNECIPAQALPEPLPIWDNSIYGNSTPTTDQGLTIQAIDDYFNMDPTAFGLTYQIFVVEEVYTITSTTLLLPTPAVAARQAQTSVPGACYPWCNNCLLEAQSRGKISALCVPGSAFEVSLNQCEQCVSVHKSDGSGSFVQISPQFQQFLDYCGQFATVVLTSSVTAVTTNTLGSAYSSVSPVIWTTVTPKSSVTVSTSASLHTSVTVVVETTATTETLSPSTESTSTSTATKTLNSSSKSLPVITTTTVATSSGSTPSTLSSESPYTTTATVPTTLFSLSTVGGSQWSQITIILPLGDNSTTTVYGSDLTSGATLVLPEPSTTSSYLTTKTVTPGHPGSGSATAQSTTSPAAPSTFSGGASRPRVAVTVTAGTLSWETTMLGLVITCAAAFVW
ncbi:hypothetical protein A1O3_07723 [Capronia epimyces CBS 606.96]|uniref:Uncharacterized protein n=1 Tax=Capronia epimyces CBS 606.96 TaxID=1182542 RepID=W9XWT0_9EURO|nr:uncharacterized protein A1O3_07723 [Capronia epimyces CBS 606.96]EXJ81431.1 hypothetical protein A1O3_07723 [Capronia epimyces CBS 606.96]